MFAEVKILLEGYTNADNLEKTEEERSSATVTLVRDKDVIMVVDPGTMVNQKILVEALAREGLKIENVTHVCITHSHIDHYKNVGMFPHAKVLEFFGLWHKNKVDDWTENFTENIKIIRTPGHDYSSITLFVKTNIGVIAICGDVFWGNKTPEVDPYAQDLQKLDESRELVLKNSDYVIPGHASMFKTKQSNKAITFISKAKSKLLVNKLGFCKKCKKPFSKIEDKCRCQTFLCFRCCECDDCELCNCKHKIN